MALKSISPQTGRAALQSLLREGSPLGPLKVMGKQIGRFFQIPLPGFRPFVVFGPEANRKLLVTERNKVLWRNTDPVTDLLRRGVLIVDGEEHDHYRGLMELSLHPSQLPAYTQMMISQTDRVTATWKEARRSTCWWKAARSRCLLFYKLSSVRTPGMISRRFGGLFSKRSNSSRRDPGSFGGRCRDLDLREI